MSFERLRRPAQLSIPDNQSELFNGVLVFLEYGAIDLPPKFDRQIPEWLKPFVIAVDSMPYLLKTFDIRSLSSLPTSQLYLTFASLDDTEKYTPPKLQGSSEAKPGGLGFTIESYRVCSTADAVADLFDFVRDADNIRRQFGRTRRGRVVRDIDQVPYTKLD